MLRCIVVDDESGAVEILERYVTESPELELVGSFRDSIKALTFLASTDVDLVFLDIDMPNLDGMHLAELIRGKDLQVVFCTAYSEYAVESYEKNALDYLLKPIAYERFRKAVDKVLQVNKKTQAAVDAASHISPDGKLFIKSGPKIHQLDVRDLLYMEKQGHYIVFHLPEEELLSRMNMQALLKILPGEKFFRIHRSYVIAIDKIDTIYKHAVVVQGKRIPIGDSFRTAFFKQINYSGT